MATDDFESFMKQMGVQSDQRKSSKPTKESKKQKPPKRRGRLDTPQKQSPLELSLEELEKEDRYREYRLEIESKEKENQLLQDTIQQLQGTLFELHETLQSLQNQLNTEKIAHEELQQNTRLLEEQLRSKEALLHEMETKQNEAERLKNSEQENRSQKTLSHLFEEQGIVRLEDQLAVLHQIVINPQYYPFVQRLEVEEDVYAQYIQNEIYCINENIPNDSIEGIVLEVEPKRCELTAGIDLRYATREIITEMLMNGLKRIVLVGIPDAFQGLLRELLSHESMVVNIEGEVSSLSEIPSIERYNLVVVCSAEQNDSMEEKNGQFFLTYSLKEQTIGQALLSLSRTIPELVLD